VFELNGKVVVISGGNAGIGLGFARGIARAGGDVVIWGRREEKNAEAAAALTEFDGRVFTQAVDVSDETRVVTAMAEAVEEMGRVDGVIANAGVMSNERTFVEMSSDAWHGLLARARAT
jgi:NAD(P)-dependent dehydrogenase (short-subunit alcohol dehydrogenase family)